MPAAQTELPALPHASTDIAVPSTRAMLARSTILSAALLGVLADAVLRNGPGLGLLVWVAAFAASIVALVLHSGQPLSRESRVWLTTAILFAAGLSWRNADTVQVFDVFAMLASLVLLATSISGAPVLSLAYARVRDLIRAAFRTGLDVVGGVIPLVARDAEPYTVLSRAPEGGAMRIGRALLITAPIVLVFMLLLTHADPVFGSLFALPQLDFEQIFSHVLLAGFFAWIVSGWLRGALLAPRHAHSESAPPAITLAITDITIALGALNVLFAAFVAVQVGWLFGGEALVVKTTGLSYAEYARRGFMELTTVAALLLPVLLGANALISRDDARALRRYRQLAVPLVALLGAIIVSAAARMQLYVHYYGISTDRLYASVFMAWLVIVFVWFTVTVLRRAPRKFALGFVTSGFAVLACLNILSPDAFVARANLARAGSATTGAAGADLPYVASLGGDAVPILVAALTSSNNAVASVGSDVATPECKAANVLLKRWAVDATDSPETEWTRWNLGRSRALSAVREHEAELRAMACPETTAAPQPDPVSP